MCRFKEIKLLTFCLFLGSFNTSYVSVQGKYREKHFIGFWGFNTSYVSVQVVVISPFGDASRFQYILCVGSRLSSYFFIANRSSFNTSYVSVQALLIHPPPLTPILICFNTSYVSVQVIGTKYVKEEFEFQYILCVGSRNAFFPSIIR